MTNVTLEQSSKFDEDVIERFAVAFCAHPFDLAVSLYKNGILFDEIDRYQLFSDLFYSNYTNDKHFKEFADFIFKIRGEIVGYKISDEIVYFNSDTGEIFFNKDNLSEFEELFKHMFNFSNKKEEKYMNRFSMKKELEYLAEMEETEKKDGISYSIYDFIEPVILEGGYNYDSVWDLTLIQYQSLVKRIVTRQDYNNTMTGLYSGTISSKSIDFLKINWLIEN